jgi:hypothetical protein
VSWVGASGSCCVLCANAVSETQKSASQSMRMCKRIRAMQIIGTLHFAEKIFLSRTKKNFHGQLIEPLTSGGRVARTGSPNGSRPGLPTSTSQKKTCAPVSVDMDQSSSGPLPCSGVNSSTAAASSTQHFMSKRIPLAKCIHAPSRQMSRNAGYNSRYAAYRRFINTTFRGSGSIRWETRTVASDAFSTLLQLPTPTPASSAAP